jgi:hypothetical protein
MQSVSAPFYPFIHRSIDPPGWQIRAFTSVWANPEENSVFAQYN